MSAKVQRCRECNRRVRSPEGWNVDRVAGLEAGLVCPACQTPSEDTEAEFNGVVGRSNLTAKPLGEALADREGFVRSLLRVYPTPEVLRSRAGVLERNNNSEEAVVVVRLLRAVAQSLDNGTLWGEGGTLRV